MRYSSIRAVEYDLELHYKLLDKYNKAIGSLSSYQGYVLKPTQIRGSRRYYSAKGPGMKHFSYIGGEENEQIRFIREYAFYEKAINVLQTNISIMEDFLRIYRRTGAEHINELLTACYRHSLELAAANGCESVAFPLISAGAYGYPKDRVLQEAIRAISDFLLKNEMTVFLVVFDKDSYAISSKLFEGIDSFIDDNYVRQHTEDRCFGASVCASRRLAPSPCAMVEDTLALPDIGEHIKLDESFSVKLLKLIDAKGMEDVACYKKANVSKQTWYKILSDPHYKPSKKTVISFAVALGLTLTETQNLLSSVGFALSDSNLFDVIIKYCLTHNVYDVHDIDTVLFHYDQETLFSKG